MIDLSPDSRGTHLVTLLEAPAGAARSQYLQTLSAETQEHRTWLFNLSLAHNGSWAGVNTLFRDLLPEIEKQTPSLLVSHDYELTMLLPELRRRIQVRNPSLTDASMGDERVRNYPVDRAFRIQHGLIDLLAAFRKAPEETPWLILCDNYTDAGALSGAFFLELVRRRGVDLNVHLVLACDPEAVADTQAHLTQYGISYRHHRPDRLPQPAPEPPVDKEALRARAMDLSERATHSLIEGEIYYPELIRLWSEVGDPARTLSSYVLGLGICNHNGFYHDGVFYADYIVPRLEAYIRGSEKDRWQLLGNLFHPYAVTGRAQDALQLFLEEGEQKIHNPELRARLFYSLSMLYARYLEDRDCDLAEGYLDQALKHLSRAEISEESRFFLQVFLNNGMALVRVRQGRPDDAVALCTDGFDLLEEKLDPRRHRLHRSVLLYNTAQVYARLGHGDKALEYYGAALDMDPNYSEYHNERGNVLQQQGHFAQALDEYRLAVSLSAPYPEVHFNMGICLRRLDAPHEALAAFGRALDLNPAQPEAYLNRAEIWEERGRLDHAFEDMSRALHWSADPTEIYAARAVVLYQQGRMEEARVDLDRAIERDPSCAVYYQNRAVALEALGHTADAAADLATYLRLMPDAEDREEVVETMGRLTAAA